MKQQVALFASSTGTNITAWELSTGSQLCAYKGNASARNGLCVLGGQYLAAAQLAKGPVQFWGWHKEAPLQRSFAGGQVTCLAASPCGTYLAGGGATGVLWLWCVASGRLLAVWLPHLKAVTAAAWSDAGGFLVTGSEDTQVHAVLVGDLLAEGGQHARPLHTWSGHSLPVTAVAVGSGEANAVVATCSQDRTARLWSLAQGCLLRSVALGSPAECLALAPGEQRLYVGLASGDVAEIPLAGGDDDDDGAMLGSGPGSRNAAGGGGGNSHPPGCRLLRGHADAVTCLALTAGGAHLVVGCRDGSARLFEAASRQVVRVLDSPAKGPLTSVLVVDRHPDMGGNGGGGGGAPTRPLPLAPLCKYEGMPGTLKPWEGALVLLTSSTASAAETAASGDGGVPLFGGWDAAAAAAPTAPEAAPGDAGAAAQQLREENTRLRVQLQQAEAVAQQWAGLHGQLYDTCVGAMVDKASGAR